MTGKPGRHDGHAIDPVKLREWMGRRVLSQRKLGARLGVSDRVIRFYLSGQRRPRDVNFRKLYIALGCGPEDLLRGRLKRSEVIDVQAYRREIAGRSLLSPEQALVTLERLIRDSDWRASVVAAECIEVLRASMTPPN